jgi:hypothetical protein
MIFNIPVTGDVLSLFMNLNRLLLLLLFACCLLQHAHAQKGYLYIKKHHKRIRTYAEGDRIKVQIDHQGVLDGMIVRLRNDSVFINDYAYHLSAITKVIIGERPPVSFPVTGGQLALITAGVALATFGMTASHWETFDHALIYAATIGYAPLLLTYGYRKLKLKRTEYRIGKKFTLEVLDFYLVPKGF